MEVERKNPLDFQCGCLKRLHFGFIEMDAFLKNRTPTKIAS